jgi:hypothetical protein
VTDDHRIIHAPEYQTGMRTATERPACYRVVDDGHACAACATPDAQQDLLRVSPGCERCQAGVRAAWLYWTYCQ